LLVAALGTFLSVLPVLFSPVRDLKTQPAPVDETTQETVAAH